VREVRIGGQSGAPDADEVEAPSGERPLAHA
jgi:hypothetical protein